MPLRRWFTEHGMPSWYSWLAVVGTCLSLSAGAMWISIEKAQDAVEGERRARLIAAEDSRQASCVLVSAQVAAFRESAPATNAGRNAAKAWEELYIRFDCDRK